MIAQQYVFSMCPKRAGPGTDTEAGSSLKMALIHFWGPWVPTHSESQ